MVLGWRRAFCTSIPREKHQHQQKHSNCPKPTSSRFAFFSSNPSTPRLPTQSEQTSNHQNGTPAVTTTPASSIPNSPRLQCKTKSISPRLLHTPTPTPKSPSSFAQLLKSGLRIPKTRCEICLEGIKSGQGTAIFTAECSHCFHFPCIAGHVKKNQLLICPICGISWKELPFTDIRSRDSSKRLRVYNDDEPLMSPIARARFNPIPEANEGDDAEEEFQGFSVNLPTAGALSLVTVDDRRVKIVDASLLQEAVVVSSGHGYETYAVVLKIKAPPRVVSNRGVHRAPIDLVTVVDVGAKMTGAKLQKLKQSMRLVISSLSAADRLSIVAFSTCSKRLLPLRRMTSDGRKSARRIIDALGCTGQEASATDALKKAIKVLEDRREKNTVASIMLFSNSQRSSVVPTSRSGQMEIPIHSIGCDANDEPSFDTLLSVVIENLKLQLQFVSGSDTRNRTQVSAVYSLTSRHQHVGSGSFRVGNLYAEEERELLVEYKVPASSIGSRQFLSVRSSFKDPSTKETVYSNEPALPVPKPQTYRSSSSSAIKRLRNIYVFTRAVAESRQLIERNDLSGANRLLTAAKALLRQSSSSSSAQFLCELEVETAELQQRRQMIPVTEEKNEPLTPTSAWRAAERLAKLAMIRKSMNRVSDLHGFENARF